MIFFIPNNAFMPSDPINALMPSALLWMLTVLYQWNSTTICICLDSYLLGVPFSILFTFSLFLPLRLGVSV